MTRKYEEPVLEIILLDAGDIVTLSDGGGGYTGGDGGVLEP